MWYILNCLRVYYLFCLWAHKHEQVDINTFPKGN